MPARSSSFKAASGQLGSLPVSAIPSRECPDLGMKRLVSCHCCFPRSLTCLNTGDFLHPPRGGDESKSGPLEDGRLTILLPAVPPPCPPPPRSFLMVSPGLFSISGPFPLTDLPSLMCDDFRGF